MRLGKLDNDQLERLILKKIKTTRPETLNAPEIGEDCAIVDLGGALSVLSTDPITSATSHLGALTVHVSCNDAVAAGAEPVGLLVTLLAPPQTEESDIEKVADDLIRAADEVGVDILGGHTEITDSVTRMITNATVLAKMSPEHCLKGMQKGNDIVVTKWIGLEGSAVIASDFAHLLSELPSEVVHRAKEFSRCISVVKEGRYAIMHGATAMHDITEGGLYGAAWEMAHMAQTGICIDPDLVPIREETLAICHATGIDPYRLLSSGSLLIACVDGNALVQGLTELGIPAAVIGKAEGENAHTKSGSPIEPPQADELYRLFG